MLEPATILLALSGVFLIAFMKGSFGGGFAIVGIPLLALVMDPLTAGALLAPLFVAMDVFALRYWKPATWSKPDLAVLLPGLVAGIVAGTLLLSVLDGRAVANHHCTDNARLRRTVVHWWRRGGRATTLGAEGACGWTGFWHHDDGRAFRRAASRALSPSSWSSKGAICWYDQHILHLGQSSQVHPVALGDPHVE